MIVQEKQYFNRLFVSILLLITGVSLFFVWTQPLPSGVKLGIAFFILLINALLWTAHLKVIIDEKGIKYQFFPFHFQSRQIAWAEIKTSVLRTYNALTEFGGWGLRYTLKGTGYIMAGSKGLEVELKNGKKIIFSITKEQEIANLLQRTV